MPYRWFWAFILLLSGTYINAQSKNIYNDNLVWTQYIMRARIAEKWSIHLDIGFRTNNFLKNQAQFLIRPGIIYQFSPKVSLLAGYAYFETSQFLNGYQDVMRPEQRLFQRVTVIQNASRFEIRHRYRLEERFNHNYKSGELQQGYTFFWRAGYQLIVTMPINHAKMTDRTWYVYAADEVFVNFGKPIYNYFDQNRFSAGLGFQFNKNVTLSAFYQYVFGQQATGTQLYEYNTLGVVVLHSMDFRKKED